MEALCPLFAGKMLDSFPGLDGYKMIFAGWLAVTVVGIVLVVIWLRMTKEKRKELLSKKSK